MPRTKGSKNKPKETQKPPETPETDQNEVEIEQNNPEIEQKPENQVLQEEKQPKIDRPAEFITPIEAAEHFGVDERAVKLWIEHGHLEIVRGGLIPMSSIKSCRFKVRKIM